MDDADFQEELVVVSEEGKPKSNLSLAERQAKAMELQKEIRAKQEREAKARARQNEIDRRKQDKEMADAKIINDERQHKLHLEAKMKEKKELEERMDRQRQLYECEQRERFGPDWKSKVPAKKDEVAVKTGSALSQSGIEMVASLYTEMRCPGVAQTCFKTCFQLLNNLLKDPSNEKYRKVNLENNAIKTRIGTINGGLNILKGGGFEKNSDGTAMNVEQSAVNTSELTKIVDMLKEKIRD